MSYTIVPVEHEGEDLYPYSVKVNGETLMGKYGERRFKDSIAAALAGTKEVDRMRKAARGEDPTSAEPK